MVGGYFQKKPYLPVIKLYSDDTDYIEFNPFTSTYEFAVQSMTCRPVFDGTSGRFKLNLTTSDGDQDALQGLLELIDIGNKIHISVGKTEDALQGVFLGVVEKQEIMEENRTWRGVHLSEEDWESVYSKG